MRLAPAFDREQRGARHRRGQRLRAAHAAEAAGQDPAAGEIAAKVLAAGLDEGLVGALHDALGADVDPGPGGHLAVHHQALAIELVEVLPGRPVRHQVGVGDQHPRRVRVGPEHADRLARLDQQRLVVAERAQASRRCGRSRPSRARRGRCRRRPPAPRALGHLGVEVVHQHPQRRLGVPAACGQRAAARRADAPLLSSRADMARASLYPKRERGRTCTVMPPPLRRHNSSCARDRCLAGTKGARGRLRCRQAPGGAAARRGRHR